MPISPLDKARGIKSLPALNTLKKRREAVDLCIKYFNTRMTYLAEKLRSGQMGVEAWQLAMRGEVKFLHRSALIIAHGGDVSAISYSEWGRLGGHLRVQYQYLNNYAKKFQQSLMNEATGIGKAYSEKYLAYRSQLYGGSARATFYRGLAMGLLPQVPGDGQTQCLTNCKCELVFEEGDEHGLLLVYWVMHPEAEHCPDCEALSQEWNPYELWFPFGMAREWALWVPRIKARVT